MKKIVLIMILLSSMCYSVSFKLGVSANYQYFNDYDELYLNGFALYLGAGFKFDASDLISINFETLMFLNTGGSKFFSDYNVSNTAKPVFGVEIPVYLNFNINNKLNFYAGGFGYVNIISTHENPNIAPGTDILDVKYNDFLLGGILIGTRLPLNRLFIDIRYKFGLHSEFKIPEMHNHQISVFFCTSY